MMKTVILASAIFISCIVWAFTFQQKKIAGRWETKMPNDMVAGIVFKSDNTFQGYINKKVFVAGSYDLKDDNITFFDNSCAGKGTYRLSFFADSVRFNLVSDTCKGRSGDVDKAVFGRVKPTQNASK